jgi:Guanylate-binding protein, N-terminal domain
MENGKHPFGQPIKVWDPSETDQQRQLYRNNLENILLDDDVQSRKVVIYSVTGAFRKGKSFFLDYCLRYLYSRVS